MSVAFMAINTSFKDTFYEMEEKTELDESLKL